MTRGASVKVVPWNYDFNVDVEKGGKQAVQFFLPCTFVSAGRVLFVLYVDELKRKLAIEG